MSPVLATASARVLSEKEMSALMTLLADEDQTVYRTIRDRILSMGPAAAQWLKPQMLSHDPVLRRRVREVFSHFARQESDTRFLGFCVTHGDDLDLEEAAWLLAQTQYPEINRAGYSALMDSFAASLRERIAGATSSLHTLQAINDYLFKELDFAGDQQSYYDPDNSYLNRVIDRRAGNPISLATLYWLLAKRLALPVVGVGMPGHFVCRYQSPTETIFIDAFNRGRLLHKSDCVKYLQQTSHGFHETFLAPTTPGRTLLRMCSNLHETYSHLEMREETSRIQRYLVALAK